MFSSLFSCSVLLFFLQRETDLRKDQEKDKKRNTKKRRSRIQTTKKKRIRDGDDRQDLTDDRERDDRESEKDLSLFPFICFF